MEIVYLSVQPTFWSYSDTIYCMEVKRAKLHRTLHYNDFARKLKDISSGKSQYDPYVKNHRMQEATFARYLI